MPEIIEHGRTGFIVEDEVGSITAVSRLGQLSRELVRAGFEARFTARRMAEHYLAIYRSLAAAQRGTVRAVLMEAAE